MKIATHPINPTNPITPIHPSHPPHPFPAPISWKHFVGLLVLTIGIILPTFAQPRIYGTIIDGADTQSLPSATVTLRSLTDSTLVAGAISRADGSFSIDDVPKGEFFLTAGFIGYQSHITDIRFTGETDLHTGPIVLQQQSIEVGEALIVAERQRGKSHGQATTWFVNTRMAAASNSGLDLLQHIPGVQVDIQQNISVQGSRRITVKVNGIVRDAAYLRQLSAGRIARIEMDMTPGSGQAADADAVLNIILKEPQVGVGGEVYAELPLSSNEHYLFPNYSLNATFQKWQFYTSYDAEISGFDIVERSRHHLPGDEGRVCFISRQSVRQDYQSHRFHYGLDFTPNSSHQLSFYAYHNPFSNEHNGSVSMESRTNGQSPTQWEGTKTDHDRNSRSFYSLYYQHRFEAGGAWSLDASHYRLKGDNSTRYDYLEPTGSPSVITAVKPFQQTFDLKTDYQIDLMEKWSLKSGISLDRKEMEDRLSDNFSNLEQVLSGYVQVGGEAGEFQFSGGLRAEHWTARVVGRSDRSDFELFPHASLQWRVNSRHRTALAYRRSLQRPHLYQLNPYVTILDPYSTMAGKADLRPVLRSQLQIDHSITFASNHVGFQLFYAHSENLISPVTLINQGVLESRYQNAGDLRQWGFQVTGGLNLFKKISVSPYFKVFHNQHSGHELANGYRVSDQSGWACDASLSAIVDLSKSTVAALVVQHKSPLTTFQNKYFNDALYFVSIDQTLGRHWKIGLKTALPLAGAFVYRGHEIKGADFHSTSDGTIYTSAIPLWVHVRFRLGRGGRVERVDGVERVDRGGKGF